MKKILTSFLLATSLLSASFLAHSQEGGETTTPPAQNAAVGTGINTTAVFGALGVAAAVAAAVVVSNGSGDGPVAGTTGTTS